MHTGSVPALSFRLASPRRPALQLAQDAVTRLRPLSVDDTPGMTRFAVHRDVAEAMLGAHDAMAPLSVRRFLHQAGARERDGLARYLAVESAGQFVGCVSLTEIDRRHASANLHIWLGAPFWGRGLATSAGCLVAEIAFSQMRLNRLQAFQPVDCQRSVRLLNKLAFTREGVLREGHRRRGRFSDMAIWSRLASDPS
ncbi:MAG: GNAT family protein [Pseudomonadota bacterium]